MHAPPLIHRAGVSVLLIVFLIGGLVAPLIHRAHHGLVWGEAHATLPETCDHSQHSDSFEVSIPDFLDDDCLLCVRPLLHFEGQRTGLRAYLDYTGYALPFQSTPTAPHFILLPIRGPPLAS